MTTYTQINGRVQAEKLERFKKIVKKTGKKQEFAIEEALDMWSENFRGV